jgi:osmotically-inducible protein OsmY
MNIDVDTQEGVVYLTGRVHSAKEKREAEDLAESTDGVRDVKNMLEVGDIQK